MTSRHARYDPSSRKKEEQEELLVFGYSCKLFRDDEKALYIDQGKHLIPWMGDDTLKIDRYDVRGTVADLRPLEPLPGGATEAQWSALSDSERKAEHLCDEERYRALYHNEAEEALYQEEELKRLHQALDSQHSYGQVGYNYDDANAAEQQTQDPTLASADAEEDDQEFVAPPELDIPVGMVLPDKCKLNAIIEKTALFISTQGPQMEIILKTKQANNPQFEFLSFDCPLHSYYRHLLMAIKTGRYRPQEQQQEKELQESDADDSYLHPSLAPPPARVELAPSIPSINYKPSADCAYSMLVSKIKDKQLKSGDSNSGPSSPQPSVAFPSSSKRRKAGYPSSGSSTRSGSGTCSSSGSSGSCSESEGKANQPAFLMPPNDIQLIIDKMASYVLKNGRDFESVVRSKGDVRFGFLDASHEYHPYYEHKIRVYQGVEPPYVPGQAAPITRPRKKKKKKKERTKSLLLPQYESSSTDNDSDVPRTVSKKGKSSKTQAPVSFSIKKPKETEILQEIRSALPLDLEESSDNEEDESKEKKEEKKEKESSESKSCSRQEEKHGRQSRKDEKAVSDDADLEKFREEELRKTRKLLKEKEMQLREKEREKERAREKERENERAREREKEREKERKRNEDIFPTPIVPKENTEESKNLSDQLVDLMNNTNEDKKTPKEKQEKEEKIVDIDDDLITEAEIIDLTDEKVVVPKSKEINLKLERKRRAAAFLSRLKYDQKASSNGTSKDSKGDSEVISVPSPPSPPSPPRLTELNGSTIPKHSSLLARLAASNVVSKQPPPTSVDRRHKRRKSDTPKKRSRSRSSSMGRQSPRNKKHKKKKYDSPDRERTRSSRSRSRSVMSPTKVYQRRHRDHNPEHRYNSHYDREEASSFRQKSFKHKTHKHFKHRRERPSTENEGDDDVMLSQKYKYKHRSKNGHSSDSSGE